MKRSGKSNEQVQKFPKTASPKADSRAVVVNKTQEQLVDEPSLITRQATGTQSHEVADRIIEQVAGVHVWPRQKDASNQVIQAVLHHGGDGAAECDRSHTGCLDDRSQ